MMGKSAEGKVGSKGELFLPKEIREHSGFSPGDKIIFLASENEVRAIKALSVTEALKRKPFAKITFNEFEKMTDEIIP
jgi:bifunctional DNA-binding transcriptional regulator/antitoxin component of YhaV-PrlF toxin-antitoxin module